MVPGKTKANTRRTGFLKELRGGKFFYLLIIPGCIWLIMFCYLPMAGLYIVFERYTNAGGLFGSQFVGLQNFRFFFASLGSALRATRNTLVINVFSILLGTAVNVGLAIAVNEIGNGTYRKITQSIMLFPHFISWIVIGMISLTFFDEKTGLFNQIIRGFGAVPVSWYTKPEYWWPILVLANVWKGAGYGSIIYYAALTGFDQALYEAADMDGASRLRKVTGITLPLLKPTITIMFLLSIGGILFGGVDQIMGLTNLNPLLLPTTDTIATFVYRSAIVNGQFESASAITLYQSVFGFFLVLGANALVRKIEPEYALF